MKLGTQIVQFLSATLVLLSSMPSLAQSPTMNDAEVTRMYGELVRKHPNTQLRKALSAHEKTKPTVEMKHSVLKGETSLPLTVTTMSTAKGTGTMASSTTNRCRVKCKKNFIVVCKPPRFPKIWDVNSCEPTVTTSEPCDVVCDGVDLK